MWKGYFYRLKVRLRKGRINHQLEYPSIFLFIYFIFLQKLKYINNIQYQGDRVEFSRAHFVAGKWWADEVHIIYDLCYLSDTNFLRLNYLPPLFRTKLSVAKLSTIVYLPPHCSARSSVLPRVSKELKSSWPWDNLLGQISSDSHTKLDLSEAILKHREN